MPQIAGTRVTSQPIDVTLESIRRAKAAGARVVLFTSDNFNKYGGATELLARMVGSTESPTQIAGDPGLLDGTCLLIFEGCPRDEEALAD